MKNIFFDKVRQKITRAVILASLSGNAALMKTMAVFGVTLALTAISVSQFTTTGFPGAAAATVTGRAAGTLPVPSAATAPRVTAVKQRTDRVPISGYVDMHTHPMSHLGFGKKLVHGAPDIDMIVPKGTHNCNKDDFRASTMGEALGSCASTHGGWGLDNTCGDYIRAVVINHGIDDGFKYKLPPEQNLHGDHQHAGSPAFQYWPHQTSKLHQQMWWEWIKRAHEGGLRVMVALSVNSQLLAKAVNGDSPTSDVPSSDLQIREIKRFVGRHPDFMEIAYSAEDLRRIVGDNKLAVILGMEIDDFGGFNQTFDNPILPLYTIPFIQQAEVKKEIKRIHDLGVRYVFPIHLTNNKFGGTAVYNPMFNFANKHNTGSYIDIEHATDASIKYDINFVGDGPDGLNNAIMFGLRTLVEIAGELPAPGCINDVSCFLGKARCCGPAVDTIKNAMAMDGKWAGYEQISPGHINKQGLTPLGEFALQEMMKMGIIIDLDHMGLKSMNKALDLAENFKGGYPVNMGHNGLRHNTTEHAGTERNVDAETIRRVIRLQGMFGLGTADLTPDEVIEEYRKVVKAIEGLNWINTPPSRSQLYGALGVGTDANGLEPLPKATAGLNSATFYSNGFTKLKTGERTWDYTKEGVAHYGLMNEFMRDVKTRNKEQDVYKRLWNSAEYFARMWEKCETVAGGQ